MGLVPYSAGPSKEVIRDYVFLYFLECSNILTLPNLYFGLEKQFMKNDKKVTCIERDVDIYNQQLQTAPSGLSINYSDVVDWDVSKYDGIFLDLCGTYGPAASHAFNNMKSGAKIAVTFLMARESKLLQQVINIRNREETYMKLLETYGIFVTKYITYNDGSPMCTFFGRKENI